MAGKRFTPEEIAQLSENVSHRRMAERLGRSTRAVCSARLRLGIVRWGNYFWTPQQDAVLQDLYGVVPCSKIAKRLNRSVCAVYDRARKLGIQRDYIRKSKDWEADE